MSTSVLAASSPELPEPAVLVRQYLQSLRMRNCSPVTLYAWERHLLRFIPWSGERGITTVAAITPELLAAYRRWLFHYRSPKTGESRVTQTPEASLVSQNLGTSAGNDGACLRSCDPPKHQ